MIKLSLGDFMKTYNLKDDTMTDSDSHKISNYPVYLRLSKI